MITSFVMKDLILLFIPYECHPLEFQAVGGKQLPDVINDILKEKWDHEKLSFSLPPLMSLVSLHLILMLYLTSYLGNYNLRCLC